MITASIVTYKSDKQELSAVLGCMCDSSIERVWLVDNSPTDELREFVQIISPKIEYIFGQGNVGYGSAHNIAIRKSIEQGAQYHAVVNPDIYFEKGAIEQLIKYMDANPDVGQVMPKIVYPNGDLQYVCKLIPTPSDLIFKRFLPSSLTKKSLERFQLKFTGYNTPINAPYLSGCFMFFRIDSLNKIGLFDERFFMYPEDIDITRRMHRQYRTMFYPNITVIHAHAAESKTSRRMLWIHITNMIKYFNKWGWFFDSQRREFNIKLLNDLNYTKTKYTK